MADAVNSISERGRPAGGNHGQTAEPPAAAEPIVDVWSRTAPKYRIRSVLLLGATFALFSGLCVFTNWLHQAELFEFSPASYVAPFKFWGPTTQNLNDFLRYPISVEQRPMHGVVLGLLVASIVAVPILVSILYRFPFAMPFVAAVLIFAHLPWMSLTLLGGCVLASVRPFRMSFRFGSALLGMLPVVLYLYLATWDPPDQSLPASPGERSRLIMPWILAILAACLMMAAVLVLARIVDFRPGAIAPIMGLMFATPAVIFYQHVGRDELAYRVLETEFGPTSARFRPVSDARPMIRRMTWDVTSPDLNLPFENELTRVWGGRPEGWHDLVIRRMWRRFLADRAETYEACSRFIADHRDSRYVPNVLYIQSRILDTRLDEQELRLSMRRELYSDFPHGQSEPHWTALLHQYPDSPLAFAAGLRLAELRLRVGDVDGALECLDRLASNADGGTRGGAASQPARRSWFGAEAPESSLAFDPRPHRFGADRLRDLIMANRDDPLYGNEPLKALAALDRRREGYLDALLRLASEYRGGLLYDNLMVRWAAAQRDMRDRYTCLAACAEQFSAGDALPEAIYQLAELEIQKLAEQESGKRATGINRLRELVARFENTCWGRVARERLDLLQPALTRAEARP